MSIKGNNKHSQLIIRTKTVCLLFCIQKASCMFSCLCSIWFFELSLISMMLIGFFHYRCSGRNQVRGRMGGWRPNWVVRGFIRGFQAGSGVLGLKGWFEAGWDSSKLDGIVRSWMGWSEA